MQMTTETLLDFDRSVDTEDRFAIRKTMGKFANAANTGDTEMLGNLISDSTVVEGFSDLPFMKQEFISVISRWKGGVRIMRFPKLKLSYNRYLYHLSGTYEEFIDNILVTEGTIELALIKAEDGFQFVKIIFYPRMRLAEE
jgi:hypothetical protein